MVARRARRHIGRTVPITPYFGRARPLPMRSPRPRRPKTMTTIYTGASVSLDGYISGPGESGFEHLFAWYGNGDVEMQLGGMDVKLTEASARHLTDNIERTGALIVGRKLFDYTNGWRGRHPMGVPVVVLSHSVPEGWARDGAWFVFRDTLESAVETADGLAGDKVVGVNGGTIASQCLDAGLLDEVWVDLVPVILGAGTPYFSSLGAAPHALEGPISITEGRGVTHLRYRVKR